jgi:serine/threonine protein kinase
MSGPRHTHLALEVLLAYAQGELSESPAERVSKHLEQCPDCTRRFAELEPTVMPSGSRSVRTTAGGAAASAKKAVSAEITSGSGVLAAMRPLADLPEGLAALVDYEFLGEFGSGGPVRAFLADNRLMGRLEVLKVLGQSITGWPELLDRFMKDIGALAELQHRNIVTGYSAFRSGDIVVFPVEYVEGDDLARLVKARGPLQVPRACYYAHQAAQALQYAHQQGLVHRDIKPGHLVVSRDNERPVVKLLDFGLAKAALETRVIDLHRGMSGHETRNHEDGLAEAGLPGTAAFMAPEQIADPGRADIRADIYSLGCTFYYLLSGRPPFAGKSVSEVFQAHHSMDAEPLNLICRQVPFELATLVAKMMAKEPESRFQTPGEVATALIPFFSGSRAPAPSLRTGVSWDTLPPDQPCPAEPLRAESSEHHTPNVHSRREGTSAIHVVENLSIAASSLQPRKRWPLPTVLVGTLVVLGLVGVVLNLTPGKQRPAPRVIPAPDEVDPLVSISPVPSPRSPLEQPPSILVSLPDLPDTVFAPTAEPLSLATLTPTPKPPPEPEWQWKSSCFILKDEAEVLAAAGRCGAVFREFKGHDSALRRFMGNRYAEFENLEAQFANLSQEEMDRGAEVENLTIELAHKRYQRDQAAALGARGNTDQLDKEIKFQAEMENEHKKRIRRIGEEKRQLMLRKNELDQKLKSVALVRSTEASREVYISSLSELRKSVDRTKELYSKHRDDPEVRAEINRKTQTWARNLFALGPSNRFKDIEHKLKLHEKWLGLNSTQGPREKSKRARSIAAAVPPDF